MRRVSGLASLFCKEHFLVVHKDKVVLSSGHFIFAQGDHCILKADGFPFYVWFLNIQRLCYTFFDEIWATKVYLTITTLFRKFWFFVCHSKGSKKEVLGYWFNISRLISQTGVQFHCYFSFLALIFAIKLLYFRFKDTAWAGYDSHQVLHGWSLIIFLQF